MSIARREDLPEELKEIWDSCIMQVNTNISFDSVILSDENKQKYKELIKEQQYREKLVSYGLRPSNRLLLYGASGTGKTFSLKALSKLLNVTMIYIDIAKSLSDNTVSQNISDIFKLGNYIADHYDGGILFLDECDAVAWNRDASVNADSGTLRRATNSLFQHLDQMDYRLIFASATNLLQRLDPAFERRFDIKMRFTRPNSDIDSDIKHFLYSKFVLNDDVDKTKKDIIKRRAKNNVKLSYYEIENIVNNAMKRAVLRDSNIVNTSEIYDELAMHMNFKVRVGTENDPPEIFENKLHYNPS